MKKQFVAQGKTLKDFGFESPSATNEGDESEKQYLGYVFSSVAYVCNCCGTCLIIEIRNVITIISIMSIYILILL